MKRHLFLKAALALAIAEQAKKSCVIPLELPAISVVDADDPPSDLAQVPFPSEYPSSGEDGGSGRLIVEVAKGLAGYLRWSSEPDPENRPRFRTEMRPISEIVDIYLCHVPDEKHLQPHLTGALENAFSKGVLAFDENLTNSEFRSRLESARTRLIRS